jgi:hypothetical protein
MVETATLVLVGNMVPAVVVAHPLLEVLEQTVLVVVVLVVQVRHLPSLEVL